LSIALRLQPNFWSDCIQQFVVYLFLIEKLQTSTITTYLAGVQHHLTMQDTGLTVWSKPVHQVLKGFQRDEATYLPQNKKLKYPFTRSMILFGANKLLIYVKDPLLAVAMHAALCLGLMFLFRKSEYLTGSDGQPRRINGKVVTLLAKDLCFWYGYKPYPASSSVDIPATQPDMISMYLPFTKGDQFGKGATRFFIAEPSNPDCMVRIIHTYCRAASLRPNDPIFAGPKPVRVTAAMVSSFMKSIATLLRLDSSKVALHSLRVGGLVTLFAAGVPDNLKQLAGRWASTKSFVAYARATLQQFSQIGSALNDPNLVTADHIRMFYEHTTDINNINNNNDNNNINI
jgi:hypothetical protein